MFLNFVNPWENWNILELFLVKQSFSGDYQSFFGTTNSKILGFLCETVAPIFPKFKCENQVLYIFLCEIIGYLHVFSFVLVFVSRQADHISVCEWRHLHVRWSLFAAALIALLTASDLLLGSFLLSPQGIHTFSLSTVGRSLSIIVPSPRGSIYRTQTKWWWSFWEQG